MRSPRASTDVQLKALGYRPHHAAHLAALEDPALVPGRVVAVFQHLYRVVTDDGEVLSELAGKLRHRAQGKAALPAIGDFVAIRLPPHGGNAVIQSVLPRDTAFTRKAAGLTPDEQVVAANVDTVFLLVGVDRDYNLRRLERYLAATKASGAKPVVVLTKVDLTADAEALLTEVAALAVGVPVHPVSATQGLGIDALTLYLVAGQTLALLGSSGVGKSTLLNTLLGTTTQSTRSVRETDQRGRHTTSHRELFILPSGALIIDTPGMRELKLWEGTTEVESTFAEIIDMARACRFSDCTHTREPGCAVSLALSEGTLPRARYDAYQKLTSELAGKAKRRR